MRCYLHFAYGLYISCLVYVALHRDHASFTALAVYSHSMLADTPLNKSSCIKLAQTRGGAGSTSPKAGLLVGC